MASRLTMSARWQGTPSTALRLSAESSKRSPASFLSARPMSPLRPVTSTRAFAIALVRTIHEHVEREAGRGPSSGAGERSSYVTHLPESPPSRRRTGFGGPTPPERSPAPAATRPGRTCGTREQDRLVGADAVDPFAVGAAALAGTARGNEGRQSADALARVADTRQGIGIVDGQELVEHWLGKLLRGGGHGHGQAQEGEEQQMSHRANLLQHLGSPENSRPRETPGGSGTAVRHS